MSGSVLVADRDLHSVGVLPAPVIFEGIGVPDPITALDRQCGSTHGNDESAKGCGLGAELALVMPLVWGVAAGRRRRASRATRPSPSAFPVE